MTGDRPLSWIFTFSEHEDESVEIPEDLTPLSDDDLESLQQTLLESFNAVRSSVRAGSASVSDLEEVRTVSLAIDRVRTETDRRAESRAEMAAEVEALAERIGLQAETETENETESETETTEENGGEEIEAVVETEEAAPSETVAAAAQPATPPTQEPVTAELLPARKGTLQVKRKKLNVPLSEVQRRAPDPELGGRQEATVVVAPDVPSFPAGNYLTSLDTLGDAVHRRAKTLGNPSGQVAVATIKREFDITLDRDSSPEAVWDIVKRSADPEHLVAAGGWCAPSTIIYDFFNIACDDGIIDLPTVGVTRGGIRFPESPSIASVLNSQSVFLWTEANDVAATGTAGPRKPCVRVPCPGFEEERLDCHGICVTAGNLMDSAFPELIQNHLSLTMTAHRHIMNMRFIADMVSLSTAVTVTGDPTGQHPYTTGILNAIALQAADYREKFRMCEDDVLEVVLPRWALEAVRADVAKRTGVDMLAVTNAEIMSWFDVRNVRVQFVSDWQLGSAGEFGQDTALTAWPTTVQFMIYAAGTFVLGSGLELDLGVVRDSTLNETNDHTAAWTEECHLIAQIGHESRVVTVNACVSGRTGAHDLGCGL